MLIARVEGSAISTIHHPSLKGWRQLICQPLDDAGNDLGSPILVCDNLGAGMHQQVVVTADGKSIRQKITNDTPLRYMTIGVVDEKVTEPEAVRV